MAGNTKAVNPLTLKVQWESTALLSSICSHWTISKDQLIRLRIAVGLPPRRDCARGAGGFPEPDAAEILASENSLDLAPLVAAAVTAAQANWTCRVQGERCVHKVDRMVFSQFDTGGLLDWIEEE